MSKATDEIMKKRLDQISFLSKACMNTNFAYTLLCDKILEQYEFFSNNSVLEIPCNYNGKFTVSVEVAKVTSPFTDDSDFSYVLLKDPRDNGSLTVDKNLLEQLLGTHHICIYCYDTDDGKSVMEAVIFTEYISSFKEEYLGSAK